MDDFVTALAQVKLEKIASVSKTSDEKRKWSSREAYEAETAAAAAASNPDPPLPIPKQAPPPPPEERRPHFMTPSTDPTTRSHASSQTLAQQLTRFFEGSDVSHRL
jgi:hypothetical protein